MAKKAKKTVRFNPDEDAETLRNVMRRNTAQDRKKYGVTIIKTSEKPGVITTPSGQKVKLKQGEYAKYQKSTSRQRQEYAREQILFKAQGTFQGSKPSPNSPYQTAGPFFSIGILGQQLWPGNQDVEKIHAKLSRNLNDRHRKTGQIGDWRVTHAKQYRGYWSYLVQKFVAIHVKGNKARNQIIYTISRNSDDNKS